MNPGGRVLLSPEAVEERKCYLEIHRRKMHGIHSRKTGPKCWRHQKTQLSSPALTVIFSVSHLQGLLALPHFLFLPIFHTLSHFLFQNSFTLSVTALISSLQFPFDFLCFRIQLSLIVTTSSLSASKLSLLNFLLVVLGCVMVRC